MLFAILFTDKPDHGALRAEQRPAPHQAQV